MEICSSLLVFLLLYRLFKSRPERTAWQWPPFVKPLGIFLAVAVVSVFFGVKPTWALKWQDVGALRFFLLYFFLYYQLRYFTPTPSWLRVLWVVTLFFGVYGVFQHFFGIDIFRPEGSKIIHYAIEEEKLGPRVLGAFDWHLSFANIYLMYASAFLSLALSVFPRRGWILAHAMLLCAVCVWTSSRIAWFATSVTVALCALRQSWKFFLGAMIVFGSLIIVTFLTNTGMRERLARTIEGSNPGYNFTLRQCVWEIHRDIFLDYPFLGVGFHSNGYLSEKYVEGSCVGYQERAVGNAHSTPIEILATTGVVGALAYLWFWVSVFVFGIKRYRELPRDSWESAFGFGVLIALLGFNIQGLTHLNIYEPVIAHNMAFFLALLANMGTLGLGPRQEK